MPMRRGGKAAKLRAKSGSLRPIMGDLLCFRRKDKGNESRKG